MPTIWRTEHSINQRVSDSLIKGIYGANMRNTHLFNPDMPLQEAVGYGILRGTGDMFKLCAQAGVDYWEVDRGYFRPAHFDGYYRISRNGMHPRYVDLDLPGDRLEALDINIAPWREGGEYILVCPPTDAVCEFEGLPHDYNMAQHIPEHWDLPVKIREKSSPVPLEQDLEGADRVIAYNSNIVLDALRMGIVAKAINHPACGWYAAANRGQLDRTKLFRFLSYCQFTLEEIESGYAWKTVNMIQKEGRYDA